MADQNTPLLNPEQAKKLTDNGMLSEQAAAPFMPQPVEETPLPSTPENQMATQYAIDMTQEAEAVQEVQEAERQAQESLAQKQQMQTEVDSDLKQGKALVEEKLRRAHDAQAKFLSETLVEDPEINQEIARLNEELKKFSVAEESVQDPQESTIQKDPLQDKEMNKARLVAEDAMDLKDQTQIYKNQYLDQLAQIQGDMEATEAKRAELLEEQNRIFEDAEELKRQAKESEVDPIWNDTGSSIMAAIAIGLGAYRAELTGGANQGLKLVNDIIDRKVRQRQQSFKNQLALKSALMDKTNRQLQNLNSQTSSQQRKAQIATMQQQIQAQQEEINRQLLQQAQRSRINDKLRAGRTTLEEEQAIFDTLSKQQIEQANNLRKDYEKRLKEAKIGEIQDQVRVIEKAAEDPSAVGDLSLIFSYMKVLDPMSVVREGEFATAANAGSVPERVRGAYNKLVSGERLSKNIRKNFLKEARSTYRSKLKRAQDISNRFNKLAVSQGIPPKAGLGIKDYSLATHMPKEAAYDLAQKALKTNRKGVDKVLKARGQDIFQLIEGMKR